MNLLDIFIIGGLVLVIEVGYNHKIKKLNERANSVLIDRIKDLESDMIEVTLKTDKATKQIDNLWESLADVKYGEYTKEDELENLDDLNSNVTNYELLQLVRHRFKSYQSATFTDTYNDKALASVEMALNHLNDKKSKFN